MVASLSSYVTHSEVSISGRWHPTLPSALLRQAQYTATPRVRQFLIPNLRRITVKRQDDSPFCVGRLGLARQTPGEKLLIRLTEVEPHHVLSALRQTKLLSNQINSLI